MTTWTNRKMKWGFSSMGAPEMDLEQLTRLAARLECPHLELRTLEGTIDIASVLDRRYPDPEDARKAVEAEGVGIVCMNSSFKLTEADEPARTSLEGYARWADHLGARYIRIFGGGKWNEPVGEDRWKLARENLEWWKKEKAARGWKAEIIVETHDAFSGTKECLELFDKLGTPLPLLWDTHHTWKLAGESPGDSWNQLREHIRHVHIKDSVSKPSDRHPYTYVALGSGEFPLRETLRILDESGYEGVVSVEWEKLWHPYLAPMETALTQAREAGLW